MRLVRDVFIPIFTFPIAANSTAPAFLLYLPAWWMREEERCRHGRTRIYPLLDTPETTAAACCADWAWDESNHQKCLPSWSRFISEIILKETTC